MKLINITIFILILILIFNILNGRKINLSNSIKNKITTSSNKPTNIQFNPDTKILRIIQMADLHYGIKKHS